MSTCICGNPKSTSRIFFCGDCFISLPPLMRDELRLSFTTSPRGGLLYERALAWLGERKREAKQKEEVTRRQADAETPKPAPLRVSEF